MRQTSRPALLRPRRKERAKPTVGLGSDETTREPNTGREDSKARSSAGAKSVLNPSAWHSAPISFPWRENQDFLPEAKTEAAEGDGAMIFLRRSTAPPSISTQRNGRMERAFRHAASSACVCCADSILRANKITPEGCHSLSMFSRLGSNEVASKPMIRSWPTCWRREVRFMKE